jgi:osmotically-inducible protein OsmY
VVLLAVAGGLVGCSRSTQSPDVSKEIKSSLEQAELKDVSVSQDRDKGIVTLGGKVVADADKLKAEALAKSFAGTQVVANEIAVVPPGMAKEANQVNKDLDAGIESNLNAALIAAKLHDRVKYSVANHVVTLTGDVDSRVMRARAEEVATGVPNVQQVVNDLQVLKQKATSSKM